MGIGDLFSRKERVLVFEARAHDVRPTRCVVDRETRLIRSGDGAASWPLPEFDPTPVGKDAAFVAIGAKIVPWPSKEKPAWDVMDDGTKIEITPEHLDQVAEHAHKLGRLAAVGEMSMTDRIIHMAAGAALGLVLGFILIKYLGFSIVHGNGGTVVTIQNATATNATSLANAAMLPIIARIRERKEASA
jgi:hypothetical protein